MRLLINARAVTATSGDETDNRSFTELRCKREGRGDLPGIRPSILGIQVARWGGYCWEKRFTISGLWRGVLGWRGGVPKRPSCLPLGMEPADLRRYASQIPEGVSDDPNSCHSFPFRF